MVFLRSTGGLSLGLLLALTIGSDVGFAARVLNVPPSPAPSPSPSPSPGPSSTAAGQMEFAITPFANMEHGWHIFEPGYRAVCTDSQGVVATAILSIDAAINGDVTDGNGAYQALIIRPVAQYIRAGATSGNCQLSICLDQNASSPNSPANCSNPQDLTGSDPERALSFQGNVPYQVNGQASPQANADASSTNLVKSNSLAMANNSLPTISFQTGAPGLSAWHPAFSFAAPGKAFLDAQSPIVLDLKGNGTYNLSDVWADNKPVMFDMELNRHPIATGWIGDGTGFLVYDYDNSGKVDDASKLLGEYTNAKAGGPKTFKNGFEALAILDTNHKGVIDASNPNFSKLKVWVDKNHDGKVDAGELISLSDAGIKTLNLAYVSLVDKKGKFPVVAGNEVRFEGSFVTNDGKTHKMADVWFRFRRQYGHTTAMTDWLMNDPNKSLKKSH